MIVLLFAAFAVLLVKFIVLKWELKSVLKQLEEEGIRLISVQFVDKTLEKIVLQINGFLEKNQQIMIQESKASAMLKSSIVNISHDMKTPLTSVIGYLQLIQKECLDGNIKEMADICLERTRYCNTLINDFFEISYMESQGCSPDLQDVDAAGELCEQILANSPLFDEKHIVPHFEDSGKPVMVYADKNMLKRIFQNLISNAVKYSAGDIFFHIEVGGTAVIAISNPINGELDIGHIFDRFYMEDKSRQNGCGIGLCLCREFAEAMGGSITAEADGGHLKIALSLRLCQMRQN